MGVEWKLGKLIKNKTYKLWGVNIFDFEWTDTGETAYLKDYTDGIRKDFKVYSIEVEGQTHYFAAMERGANTWLFFVGQ